MSLRAEKVGSVIKRALVEPLRALSNEYSAGLVTITSVKMTNDLHIAKVYITIYGGSMGPGEFLDILDDHKKAMRSELGHSISLRYTPELRFYLDDTLEQMEHIKNLINSIKDTDNNSTENTLD
jgi:ribosome-binding factor A